jgi:hypothetical protein
VWSRQSPLTTKDTKYHEGFDLELFFVFFVSFAVHAFRYPSANFGR